MSNRFSIPHSTIHSANHRSRHRKVITNTTAKSVHWKPNSMNHLPRDRMSRATTLWKETRPPLSRRISHTRSGSSYQPVSHFIFDIVKICLTAFIISHTLDIKWYSSMKRALARAHGLDRLNYSQVYSVLWQEDLGGLINRTRLSISPRDVKMGAITR